MAKKNAYAVDPTGVAKMAGYINGMTKNVNTGQYIGSVINYTHGMLAPRFDLHMDLYAAAHKSAFNHVYEWPSSYGISDTIGKPQHRLWRQYIMGNGKTKTAGFRFIASKRAVPVHPTLATPNENTGKHVKIGFHVFYWKAAVMEYGMPVSIAPTLGEWLALLPNPRSNYIAFTQKTINRTGGTKNTRGAFTSEFVRWWSTDAGRIFDQTIGPRLADDLVKAGALSQRMGDPRLKTFTITSGSMSAAYQRGELEARTRMKKNEREYILASLERMGNLGRL